MPFNPCMQPVRPGKLDLLFRIANFSIRMRAGGHYSLFIISKCYIHSANLRRYGQKSGHFIAWKVIMTVEAARFRGIGC